MLPKCFQFSRCSLNCLYSGPRPPAGAAVFQFDRCSLNSVYRYGRGGRGGLFAKLSIQ